MTWDPNPDIKWNQKIDIEWIWVGLTVFLYREYLFISGSSVAWGPWEVVALVK